MFTQTVNIVTQTKPLVSFKSLLSRNQPVQSTNKVPDQPNLKVEHFPVDAKQDEYCLPTVMPENQTVYNKTFKINLNRDEQRRFNIMLLDAQEKLPTEVVESMEFGFIKRDISKHYVLINNPAKHGAGTINDPKLGVTLGHTKCGTCYKDNLNCNGHRGRISLQEKKDGKLIDSPIINPSYRRIIISLLTIFCNKCGALLLTEDQILHLEKYKHAKSRIKLIEEFVKGKKNLEHTHRPTVDLCAPGPGLVTGTVEPCIPNPHYVLDKKVNNHKIEYKIDVGGTEERGERTIEQIVKIFNQVSPEDAKLVGLGNNMPIDFIIFDVIVSAPAVRGASSREMANESDRMADAFIEIIKANEKLKSNEWDKKNRDALREKIFNKVKDLNESTDKKNTKGMNQISLSTILKGKGGLHRENFQAARVDFTGRTVIGPNPTLEYGEISVPREWAKVLTVPVSIFQANLASMNKLLQEGRITTIIKGSGEYKGSIQIVNKNNINTIVLEYGDKVNRWLQDGDYITLNRMPSLHKQSLLTGRVKFWDERTLGLHLSYTTQFNADFDGDEMNVHSPQMIEAVAEAMELMTMEMCIPNEQNNAPMAGLVMDNIIGSHLVTSENEIIDVADWNNYLMYIAARDDLGSLEERLFNAGVKMYTGRALFSSFLPKNLYYRKGEVEIINGILVRGVITKDHVGPVSGSIVQAIYNNPTIMDNSNRKGLYRAAAFITDASRVLGQWLTNHGFTIGIRDCGLGDPEIDKIKQDELAKLKLVVSQMGEKFSSRVEKEKIEKEILAETTNYKNNTAKRLTEIIGHENNFNIMISSKSKGSSSNFAQVAISVGQQTFAGERMATQMTSGRRVLPHYLVNDEDLKARGFVESSFTEGLNNTEFYLHAAASREGLVHTAVSISDIGRIHRDLSTMLQDCETHYDASIRDANDLMVQEIYGSDGFAGGALMRKTVNVGAAYEDESLTVVDVLSLVKELNAKYGY